MSLTRALVLPLKAVIRAPSLRRSLTRLFWATPSILVKLPPANTCSPSGATASDSTWASSTGANAVSIAPVVASKAKMLLRAIAVVGAAALATGDDLVADLDDGGDLAVEHVRRPVRRVARHHRGLRRVHRGAGLHHQADQDRGRQERQQDTTTHEQTIPPVSRHSDALMYLAARLHHWPGDARSPSCVSPLPQTHAGRCFEMPNPVGNGMLRACLSSPKPNGPARPWNAIPSDWSWPTPTTPTATCAGPGRPGRSARPWSATRSSGPTGSASSCCWRPTGRSSGCTWA